MNGELAGLAANTAVGTNVTNRIVNGVYKNKAQAQAQIADLQAISALDKESEAQIKKWKQIRNWSLLWGGAATVLFCTVFIGACFIPVIIFGGWVHFFKLKTFVYEFPNYRYLTCHQLIQLLGADMAPQASLETILGLKPNPQLLSPPSNDGATDPDSPSPRLQGYKAWGLKRNTVECWLQLNGQLLDGTKFNFSISEASQDYGEEFQYGYGYEGKTYRVLKALKRLRWTISLRLRFKEKRYSAGSIDRTQLTQMIQLPEGAKLKKLDVRGNEFRITVITPTKKVKARHRGSIDINRAWQELHAADNEWEFLSKFSAMTFLSLYQALNGLRKG